MPCKRSSDRDAHGASRFTLAFDRKVGGTRGDPIAQNLSVNAT
jgi:hypothetical protein